MSTSSAGGSPAAPGPRSPGPRSPGPWRLRWRRLSADRLFVASAAVLVLVVLSCVLVPAFSSWRYDQTDLALGPSSPSWDHWMGTDYFGRDLMVRVFYGGRLSLVVALVATAISFVIGMLWGAVAGYFGGWIDRLMMRIVDVLYALPTLIIVILVMVFFARTDGALYRAFRALISPLVTDASDPSHQPLFHILVVFVVLGAVSWLTLARIVRGQVISLRQRAFVEAARCLGIGHYGILFRHVLPNALGPAVVYAALALPQVMLAEAFLSFLGLGTQEPLSSWGLLVSEGAKTMAVYPWMLVFPSLMLGLTLFCCNFIGDGLRDLLDPRTRRHAGRAGGRSRSLAFRRR